MAREARKIVNTVKQQVIPIEIGLSRSGDQILSGMMDIRVTPNAEKIIRSDEFNASISPEPKKLNLLCCEVGDLFSRQPSDERLWEKAGRIGNLCPAEGAPRAVIKFHGDEHRRYYTLMNPIDKFIFCLFSNGVAWLTSYPVGRKTHGI
ncbi:MAG: hypothetical protein WCS97_01240 [Candidatus Paceibacterota bacterium]|jgi:hypothetical protein